MFLFVALSINIPFLIMRTLANFCFFSFSRLLPLCYTKHDSDIKIATKSWLVVCMLN